VRYQNSPGNVVPLEIANALGYLKGVKLENVGAVTGGPEAIEAVSTDHADIGQAFNSAIEKAIVGGAPIKSVIGVFGEDKKSFTGLYVLDNSPIHSAKELIGKKVAVNTLGAGEEAIQRTWEAQQGMSKQEMNEVDLVVVPPLTTEGALHNGQVDAANFTNTIRELALKKGGIRPLFNGYNATGGYAATNTYFVNTNFMKENPKTTQKVVEGVAKAIVFLQTEPASRVIEVAKKIADENGRQEEDAALESWVSQGVTNKGGVIDEHEITLWIEYLEREGQIKPGQLKPQEAYTNQYNPYAKEGS